MARLIIELAPDLETRLRETAEQEGRDLNELAGQLIDAGLQHRVKQAETCPDNSGGRIFDMHPGAFEISDDFDAPLPDSFWLGTEE